MIQALRTPDSLCERCPFCWNIMLISESTANIQLFFNSSAITHPHPPFYFKFHNRTPPCSLQARMHPIFLTLINTISLSAITQPACPSRVVPLCAPANFLLFLSCIIMHYHAFQCLLCVTMFIMYQFYNALTIRLLCVTIQVLAITLTYRNLPLTRNKHSLKIVPPMLVPNF